MDKQKYKSGMYDYLRTIGIHVSQPGNIKCPLPSHGSNDKNPSMKVWNDGFKCYKCSEHGDIYDLAGLLNGTDDFKEKYKIVDTAIGTGESYKPTIYYEEVEKVMDIKAQGSVNIYLESIRSQFIDRINSFSKARGYGEEYSNYLYFWPGYQTAKNALSYEVLADAAIPKNAWRNSGVVCKYETGWKLMYIKDGKTIKMASGISKAFPFPNLPDSEDVVIVEGEPCAMACRAIGINAVSIGGVSGFQATDAVRLKKYKNVYVCMDADETGIKTTPEIVKTLSRAGVKGIEVIELDSSVGKDPDDYIKSGNGEKLKSLITPTVDFEESLPFKVLGYSESGHYFMGRDDMITKIPKCKLTSGHLLEVAPLSFWMDIKVNKQGNPDWTYIFDMIINTSIRKGPYREASIRGVGIWEDNGEIIASDGEYVITKEDKIPVRQFGSKYTYIRRADLGIKSEKNENWKSDFNDIKWICKNLSFKTEDDGKMLFGWIIASMFLSTISWRPVAYMKGESGVGKSWTMNNVVRAILGDICICPNKMSTVKGVLQAPAHDARMITIDELESSAERSMMDVVKGLLTLARDSTTKTLEKRFTGTADQEGQSKEFISMFLFASIVESSEEDQDVNRITAINFARKKNSISWEEIEAKIIYLIDNGFGERIRNNAVYHRESVVKNVKTFRLEASKKADKQRAADQLGTIIAGWYHLEHPGKVATREEAQIYLDTFDFTDQNERGKGKMMEVIMSPILSYKVKYEEEQEVKNSFNIESGDSEIKIIKRERTVFSVLKELDDLRETGESTSRHFLNKVLMDYGIRYGTAKNHKHMIIALNHEGVKKMLPMTFAYKSNYFDYFKNHADFVEKERSVKFNGVVFQAMAFNVDFDEDDQAAY